MVHKEFRIRYGSGGRMAMRRVSKAADGSLKGIFQFREDGKTLYGIMSFPDDPDAIDQVVIRNQTNKPHHYEGEMCLVFWAWIPGGKPVHVWLDEGAELSPERGPGGADKTILKAEYRKRPMRVELDPEHDWLPKRIEVEGSHVCEVREFIRDAGHWFPAEVVFLYSESILPAGSDTRLGFKLTELHVNHSSPSIDFGMPDVPEGANVRDERNWTGYFKGGFEARKRLEQARGIYSAPKNSSEAGKSVSNVVALPDEQRFPWEVGIAGLSIAAFALAWKLRRNS